MDRDKLLKDKSLNLFYDQLNSLHKVLDNGFIGQFNRSLPFNEELLDRWERAKKLKFGEKSSIYDSAFVFGEVKVGESCWIGPYTIIDGSGGLSIGNSCTISTGVHIYTHDNLKQTLTGGISPIEKEPVVIGNHVYIGPQSIISKGLNIGNYSVIAANSFVNKTIPDNTIVAGNPAKPIGKVIVTNNEVNFEYFKS